jgi:hypothetical protein
MFSGNTDIKNLAESVPEKKLRKIIGKAASYEVNKRYKSPQQFAAVLRKYNNRVSPMKLGVLITACLMIFTVGIFMPQIIENVSKSFDSPNSIYEFKDALIEKAIRSDLGKNETDPVYRYELMSVEGVYIISDMTFPTDDEFRGYYDNNKLWDNPPNHSFISTTEDLKFCENIQTIKIIYNTVEDFTLTNDLKRLYEISMSNTTISDISPLAGMTSLTNINLSSSSVKDLSPLKTCPNLNAIFVSDVHADNFDFLIPGKTYGDLNFDRVNYKKFYQYLNGITVKNLNMFSCGIESLDEFPDFTVTGYMELGNNPITDGT